MSDFPPLRYKNKFIFPETLTQSGYLVQPSVVDLERGGGCTAVGRAYSDGLIGFPGLCASGFVFILISKMLALCAPSAQLGARLGDFTVG